jgi:hypothetical protein
MVYPSLTAKYNLTAIHRIDSTFSVAKGGKRLLNPDAASIVDVGCSPGCSPSPSPPIPDITAKRTAGWNAIPSGQRRARFKKPREKEFSIISDICTVISLYQDRESSVYDQGT